MSDLKRLDLRDDPAAQAVAVRALERRGERARIIDLVLSGEVEAMLRTGTSASADLRHIALHSACVKPVLSLACGALEIECDWSSRARSLYCCDAALRVVGLMTRESLRVQWRAHLEWLRGSELCDTGHPDGRCHWKHPEGAVSSNVASSGSRANTACVHAVTRAPRYAPEAVSRAAVEAVGLFAGAHTRTTEERWQTRRILEVMLGVAS